MGTHLVRKLMSEIARKKRVVINLTFHYHTVRESKFIDFPAGSPEPRVLTTAVAALIA